MALTSGNFGFSKRAGNKAIYGVVAGAIIFAGGIVALYDGFLIPARAGQGADNAAKAADAAKYKIVGVSTEDVTGGAANGDITTQIENEGWYRFNNSAAGDLITAANIESVCYVVDDETVALTSPNNTRPKAGIIKDVDDAGVWVLLGHSA